MNAQREKLFSTTIIVVTKYIYYLRRRFAIVRIQCCNCTYPSPTTTHFIDCILYIDKFFSWYFNLQRMFTM